MWVWLICSITIFALDGKWRWGRDDAVDVTTSCAVMSATKELSRVGLGRRAGVQRLLLYCMGFVMEECIIFSRALCVGEYASRRNCGGENKDQTSCWTSCRVWWASEEKLISDCGVLSKCNAKMFWFRCCSWNECGLWEICRWWIAGR